MDLITSGRRWEGEGGTSNEERERGKEEERGGGGGREKDCRRGRLKKGRRAKGERWEMEEGRGTWHLLHCIISQISEVSDIPVERVEFAKVCGKRCAHAHLCSPRGLPVWLPLMFPELWIISK